VTVDSFSHFDYAGIGFVRDERARVLVVRNFHPANPGIVVAEAAHQFFVALGERQCPPHRKRFCANGSFEMRHRHFENEMQVVRLYGLAHLPVQELESSFFQHEGREEKQTTERVQPHRVPKLFRRTLVNLDLCPLHVSKSFRQSEVLRTL